MLPSTAASPSEVETVPCRLTSKHELQGESGMALALRLARGMTISPYQLHALVRRHCDDVTLRLLDVIDVEDARHCVQVLSRHLRNSFQIEYELAIISLAGVPSRCDVGWPVQW